MSWTLTKLTHFFKVESLTRGQSHITFWHKLTYYFCKLDIFTAMQQILCMLIKRSSFQKSVRKSKPKQFYEIDPRSQYYKNFRVDLITLCVGQTVTVQWENYCKIMKWSSLPKRVRKFTSKNIGLGPEFFIIFKTNKYQMVIIILQCRFIINKFGGFMLNTFGQKVMFLTKHFI